MTLVSTAVDHQQAAADPKDRISGCSSALAGGPLEEKKAFEFPIFCVVRQHPGNHPAGAATGRRAGERGHRRFALTADNITDAAFGDAMNYWQFFPVTRQVDTVAEQTGSYAA